MMDYFGQLLEIEKDKTLSHRVKSWCSRDCPAYTYNETLGGTMCKPELIDHDINRCIEYRVNELKKKVFS